MKTQESLTTQRLRDNLEAQYASLIIERLDLRNQVTFVQNKRAGRYGWFKFKEAFSRNLVRLLIESWGLSKRDTIYDPFAGCGTTLLTCKEMGYKAVGTEVLPVAAFITKVKLMDWKDVRRVEFTIRKLLSSRFRNPQTSFPDVSIIPKAFSEQTQKEILFYKEKILEFDEPEQSFLMLGLLGVLEDVSYTRKDGQYLRLVEKEIPPVKDALSAKLNYMLCDIVEEKTSMFAAPRPGKAEVYKGDARERSLPKRYLGKISAVITSPPYLNRYDYSRTYALELCTLWVNSFDDMRNIRHSLIRSHIESREHNGVDIDLPVLSEILNALKCKKLNNPRIPIMINGYFEDMNLCLTRLSEYLKPGGQVALVVANARFEGEMIPTDLMLSELAAKHGLETEEIWVSRYKGNSSQQMAKYGRVPVRETIVFWRKPVE